MNDRTDHMRKAWDERSIRLGNRKKAVLFKRFPSLLNNLIHKRHLRFILGQLPRLPGTLLDAGCGYGRLSLEIKGVYPEIAFQGVDFCEVFARAYERSIGPCFCGPIEAFATRQKFDVILAVTLLMYLDPPGRTATVKRLWEMLEPGGVMISIEPAVEFNLMLSRITGKTSADPTGGDVGYFTAAECQSHFSGIPQIDSMVAEPIGLFGERIIRVHHALSVVKKRRAS